MFDFYHAKVLPDSNNLKYTIRLHNGMQADRTGLVQPNGFLLKT